MAATATRPPAAAVAAAAPSSFPAAAPIPTQPSVSLLPAKYSKVQMLQPATVGHNMVVRVLRVKTMLERARVDGTMTK